MEDQCRATAYVVAWHIIYLGKNTNYVGKYTKKYWEPQLLVTEISFGLLHVYVSWTCSLTSLTKRLNT